jgi:hypothetical protein
MVPCVQFLPTHCRHCGAICLAALSERDVAVAACPACAEEANVVPGPRFGAHEVQLFAQLTQAARSAELRPAEAQRLCIEIERALASADQPSTLERLQQRLPQLAKVAPYWADSPARAARLLRMLETIFNALSIPSKSVTLPRMPVPMKRNA